MTDLGEFGRRPICGHYPLGSQLSPRFPTGPGEPSCIGEQVGGNPYQPVGIGVNVVTGRAFRTPDAGVETHAAKQIVNKVGLWRAWRDRLS
jgi:hypothetical protein